MLGLLEVGFWSDLAWPVAVAVAAVVVYHTTTTKSLAVVQRSQRESSPSPQSPEHGGHHGPNKREAEAAATEAGREWEHKTRW